MKKLLLIPLILFAFSGIAQVRTFLGPKGQFIYDTAKSLNVLGTYLLLPNDSTLNFDSSKVGVSLQKNATGDSIRLISGSGSILATVGSGGSSNWTVTGSDIYRNSKVAIGTITPLGKLRVNSDNLLNAPDSSSGLILSNSTAATSGVLNQAGPLLEIGGNSWNGSASIPVKWQIRQTVFNAATPGSDLTFRVTQNGGGTWTNFLSLSRTGGSGSIAAAASTSISATSFVAVNGFTGGAGIGSSLPRLGTNGIADFYTQFDMNTSNKAFGLPINTTAQRAAWVAYERMATYNSTTKLSEQYNGVSWNSVAQWGYKAATSTYTILITDFTVDCTSGTFTATLPTAVGAGSKQYVIKNSGSGVITVGTTSSQTIDGSTTYTLGTQYKSVTVQSDNANWIVVSKDNIDLASGTYTPTLTNVTNVAASTAYPCQYLRVGNTVTVSGKVDIDVTLGVASELGMSLPIASGLTAEENAGGTASSAAAASLVSAIRADAANDRVAFVFIAVSLTNDSYFFEFTYQIK